MPFAGVSGVVARENDAAQCIWAEAVVADK